MISLFGFFFLLLFDGYLLAQNNDLAILDTFSTHFDFDLVLGTITD